MCSDVRGSGLLDLDTACSTEVTQLASTHSGHSASPLETSKYRRQITFKSKISAYSDGSISSVVAFEQDVSSDDEPPENPGVDIAQKVREFTLQRDVEAQREFHSVVAAGFRVIFLAGLLRFLGFMLEDYRITGRHSLGRLFIVLSAYGFSGGIVLLSTCPLKFVDIDEMLAVRIFLRLALSLVMALESLIRILPYHLSARYVGIFLAMMLALGGPRCGIPWLFCFRMRPTAVMTVFLCTVHLSIGGCLLTAAEIGAHEPDSPWFFALPANVLEFLGLLRVAAVLATAVPYVCHRSRSRTSAFYIALYTSCAFSGVVHISTWLLAMRHLPAERVLLSELPYGIAFLVPFIVGKAVGRRRMFQIMARRLDRDPGRAGRDGAFIASLLDASWVRAGQPWWVHLPEGDKDERYETTSHRYNWRPGWVRDVRQNDIIVELEPRPSRVRQSRSMPRSPGLAESARKSGAFKHTLSEGITRTISAALSPHFPRSPAQRVSFNVGFVPRSAAEEPGSQTEVRVIKMREPGADSQELLLKAQTELHCIDWSKLTCDLITSGPAFPAWESSRPVQKDENIDFFITHSWHDDGRAKYDALERVAAIFTQAHERAPTFWLDKSCIDQSNIADGLRVLPINVMACTYMLLLCGPTYPNRLWCIWELFTLMAFTDLAQALKRLHVVPLNVQPGPDARRSSVAEIAEFSLDSARCYDPNEEARLLKIIEALGGERFSERVRTLGRAVVDRPRPLRFKRAQSPKLSRSALSERMLRATRLLSRASTSLLDSSLQDTLRAEVARARAASGNGSQSSRDPADQQRGLQRKDRRTWADLCAKSSSADDEISSSSDSDRPEDWKPPAWRGSSASGNSVELSVRPSCTANGVSG